MMVVRLGLSERMGRLVTNQELAKTQIIKSVMYMAKNLANSAISSAILCYTLLRKTKQKVSPLMQK